MHLILKMKIFYGQKIIKFLFDLISKFIKKWSLHPLKNNNLLFFNKKTGAILRLIPTEETVVKNQFINNLAIDANFSFYLNTYGSLYAVDNFKYENYLVFKFK